MKQPLDMHVTCLPLAKIELDSEDFGLICTEEAVIHSQLDKSYYLLGNSSANLVLRKLLMF